VLAAVAALLPGVSPKVTAGTDAIMAYVSDGRSQMLLTALLGFEAALPLTAAGIGVLRTT